MSADSGRPARSVPDDGQIALLLEKLAARLGPDDPLRAAALHVAAVLHGRVPTPGGVRAEAARQAGDARDLLADDRDQRADERDRQAGLRDERARARDLQGRQADQVADAHDAQIRALLASPTWRGRDDQENEVIAALLAAGQDYRREARQDRYDSEQDRQDSMGDRQNAQADRDQAAADRRTAQGDRDQSIIDHQTESDRPADEPGA